VAPAEIRGKFEIIIVGDVYPLALDRLDNECGNRARMECLLKRNKIIKWDADTVGQKGREAFSENLVAIERQRTIGETVESMLAVKDPRPAGCCSRKI
jgi:hypothetical protein